MASRPGRRAIASRLIHALVPLWLACSADSPVPPERAAERIFVGGPVLTVDADDRVSAALAIRDGRIAAVGTADSVLALRGPDTVLHDLGGNALVPGFVDGHGHLSFVARFAAAANLAPPPVGPVGSIAELQAALRAYLAKTRLPPGAWIVGNGYDDSLLAERRHPTRDELDAISSEHPILIAHVSLHLGVANSLALATVGIGADTPDPPGGVFRRRDGTREPDGVLEETALYAVFSKLPQPDPERSLALLERAVDVYASHGITTAQDGATSPADFALFRRAAEAGRLKIDVGAYPMWSTADAILASDFPLGTYRNRLKLAGVKLVLDGSPQGKTAWLTEPYHVVPAGQPASYAGYPALDGEVVEKAISDLYARNVPVIAHANGDAAADQLIRAVRKATGTHGPADRRTVMIHAQTVRDDQLDAMVELGMVPSFFVSHTFFWGDWHRDSVLGAARAARISPAASARARGLRFTFHNDPPVVPPDVLRLLWSGVNRITRSGKVLGEAERIPPMAALRALTIDGAYQFFEEHDKGSLEVGKRADLVVLTRSPLDVDPAEIVNLYVVETLKDGETIYRRSD